LILFPIGIFSTALSQAILPTFSTQALENDHDKLKQTLSFGLRSTWLVLLPASVGFMVLARPIISAIFQGGRFDSYSTSVTAQVLFCYSIGLCAYGATRILQSCFFALKDTVTPTKVSFVALIMNIVLNALLMFPLKLAGIALATSISGIISCIILSVILRKRLAPFNSREIISSFMRTLCASIGMGIVCYLLANRNIFVSQSTIFKWINLAVTIVFSVFVYAGLCAAFKVREIKDLWRILLKQNS
jgi:putative peptidoglycan lipid II flippase